MHLSISLPDAFRFTLKKPDSLLLCRDYFKPVINNAGFEDEILVFVTCSKYGKDKSTSLSINYDVKEMFVELIKLVHGLPKYVSSKIVILQVESNGEFRKHFLENIDNLQPADIVFSAEPICLKKTLEVVALMSTSSVLVTNSDLGTVAGVVQANLEVVQLSKSHTLPRNWIRYNEFKFE